MMQTFSNVGTNYAIESYKSTTIRSKTRATLYLLDDYSFIIQFFRSDL